MSIDNNDDIERCVACGRKDCKAALEFKNIVDKAVLEAKSANDRALLEGFAIIDERAKANGVDFYTQMHREIMKDRAEQRAQNWRKGRQ